MGVPINLCYIYFYPDTSIIDSEKKHFEDKVDKILSHSDSWNTFLCGDGTVKKIILSKHSKECDCKRISRKDGSVYPGCHMKISLVSNTYLIHKACPGLENNKYTLSCTKVTGTSEIYINKTNWDIGFDDVFSFAKYSQYKKDSKELYYKYVIYHEVGHALGRGHYLPKNEDDMKKNNGYPAPIMMQQTKGLYNYDVNVYPLKQEQGLFCTLKDCNHESTCKEFLIPLD